MTGSIATITTAQRRARLGARHNLARAASTITDACDNVLALHASDPATIYLSICARTTDTTTADVDRELFDDRTMMRTLAMRRTLFVATRSVLPLAEMSSSIDVARRERSVLEKALTEAGIAQPERWLTKVYAQVLDALDGAGHSAKALSDLVPDLTTRVVLGGGKHTVDARATSRVLGLMAVEGLLARGRPSGAWTGRQYVWHRRDQWIPLLDEPPSEDDAAAELVRRWLLRFGPATMTDLRWWTGWTATKTKKALAELEVVEVALDGDDGDGVGLVLADDVDPVDEPEPWMAMLPALDPTAMGWKERSWYVGEHTAALFDRNGNIGPTIWADGQIVGGWAQDANGSVVTELFTKLSRQQHRLMTVEVERLTEFLGESVVKPSFPTPLQKQLATRG